MFGKNEIILRQISKIGHNRKTQLFLVGGAVRDTILGVLPTDFDIVAVAGGMDAIAFARHVVDAIGGEIVKKTEFGTCTVKIRDQSFDFSTTRREKYSEPGALPTVEFSGLYDDLTRRDFTINSLALSLNLDNFGELFQWGSNSLKNLNDGIIEIYHSDSFRDDPTRIFRAFRYAKRLGFTVSEKTMSCIERDKHFISKLSGDRIRHELEKIFEEECAYEILGELDRMGILKEIHLDLSFNNSNTELSYECEPWTRTFGSIIHNITNETGISERLNLSAEWRKFARDIAYLNRSQIGLGKLEKRSSVYKALKGVSLDAIRFCMFHWDKAGGRQASYSASLYTSWDRDIKTSLNGNDLAEMGLQGKEIGEMLRVLLYAKIDGKVSTRGQERDWVEKKIITEFWGHGGKTDG